MKRRDKECQAICRALAVAVLVLTWSLQAQDITLDPSRADDQVKGWYLAAYDDAGNPGNQPHLKLGSDYLFPEADIPFAVARRGHPVRTAAYGEDIHFSWAGLKPGARYRLRLTFLSDEARTQRISLNGRILIPELRFSPNRILYCILDLPLPDESATYDLSIQPIKGPNAVVSIVELFSNQGRLLPDPVIEAYGDCAGRVQAKVWNRNQPQIPYSGVEVRAALPETGSALSSRCDPDGKFQFEFPKNWKTMGRQEILVTAELPSGPLSRRVSLRGIFPPQLTPRPFRTLNLINPRIDLTGIWKFNPSPPSDFPRLDAEGTADWDHIRVPGEWVMQGFTVSAHQAAAYWREFALPESWENLRCILRCDAVYSDAVVYVNGQRAGDHQGGFTAFELDVSKLVRPGLNTLALAVTNESLEDILASGSQYAAHPLGGITRKLELWAVPLCHLTNLDVSTHWDSGTQNATLELDVEVANTTSRSISGAVLRVSLESEDYGHPQEHFPYQTALPPLPAGDVKNGKVSLPVTRPLKWDCEHPHLYSLRCILEYHGRIREVIRRRIGFREVTIDGPRVLLNGRPIKLRGINRHEAHPLLGRSLTPGMWKKDAQLFRAANINFIRTSHYPPAEEFLQACDELGLLVECEAPLCWVEHGANPNWTRVGWDFRDRKFFQPLLLANLETIELNRNHPCIILWSLANESRWSPLFEDVLERVRQVDPSRLTVFHDQCWGGYNNAGSRADIANFHYPGPEGLMQAEEISRPLLFGEYCHLNNYNRTELVTDPGLRDAWGPPFQDMWEGMYTTEGILGGAVWAGIDDTFFLPSGPVVGYGSWGPLDGWRRCKPEYWHIKKTYSPIRLLTAEGSTIPLNGPLRIELENRHDFTDLEKLSIHWELSDGRRGRAAASIPPRGKGFLPIPVQGHDLEGQILSLEFLNPRGFLIDAFRIPLGENHRPEPPDNREVPGSDPSMDLIEEKGAIVVNGAGITAQVDAQTGKFRSLNFQNRLLLSGGPELMLLPLNPAGPPQLTADSWVFQPYTDPCSLWKAESVSPEWSPQGGAIRVTGSYREASGEYTIFFKNSGILEISYRFFVRNPIDPRQIGMVLSTPLDLDTLTWRRRGLWSTYPDLHIGRLSGRAVPFPVQEISGPVGPIRIPGGPWAHDGTELGSNDFRSTKTLIHWAALQDRAGTGLVIHSDGSQHIRCWVEGEAVKILIAQHSNAGAERFFRPHAQPGYRSLESGEVISGVVRMSFVGR